MYNNPTKIDENRWSHFWENQNFIFFSSELPLILGVGGKLKKTARDIYKQTLDIEFVRDLLIGFGSTIGNGQTDRQTHTHIHTHTHTHRQKRISKMWFSFSAHLIVHVGMIYLKKIENYKKFLVYRFIYVGLYKDEGQSNKNRSPAIKHIPHKSLTLLLRIDTAICRVGDMHRYTQLFFYCSGGERSVKCVRLASEKEASKKRAERCGLFLGGWGCLRRAIKS